MAWKLVDMLVMTRRPFFWRTRKNQTLAYAHMKIPNSKPWPRSWSICSSWLAAHVSKREIEVASLFPWLFLAGACSGAGACVVVAVVRVWCYSKDTYRALVTGYKEDLDRNMGWNCFILAGGKGMVLHKGLRSFDRIQGFCDKKMGQCYVWMNVCVYVCLCACVFVCMYVRMYV